MEELIAYEDKLTVISYSTSWSEGVPDLIPYVDKLKDLMQHNGQRWWRIWSLMKIL